MKTNRIPFFLGLLMIASLLMLGTTALADDDVKAKKAKAKPDAVRELEAQIEDLSVRIDRLKAQKRFAPDPSASDIHTELFSAPETHSMASPSGETLGCPSNSGPAITDVTPLVVGSILQMS